MKNILPPLNALRTFEAVARHLSMTKAAEELHVTHAAVSQQIKLLENFLNIALLQREGKKFILTIKGRTYANALHHTFSSLNQATEQLLNQMDINTLTVRIPPTLALRWFIPRMQYFQQAHPEIEIRLSTITKEIDFLHNNIDIAIYYGHDHEFSDLHKDFLFSDYLFPVCSQKLLKSTKIKPENLSLYTFLYVTAERRKNDWQTWFKTANLPEPKKESRIYFQDTVQTLQAAQMGLGFAIAHEPFVLDELKSDHLIAPFKTKIKLPENYYLVCPHEYLRKNKVKIFREWLLKESK